MIYAELFCHGVGCTVAEIHTTDHWYDLEGVHQPVLCRFQADLHARDPQVPLTIWTCVTSQQSE